MTSTIINLMTVLCLTFESLISVGPLRSRLSERSQRVTLLIKLMWFHNRIVNFDLWAVSLGLGPDSQELTHKTLQLSHHTMTTN